MFVFQSRGGGGGGGRVVETGGAAGLRFGEGLCSQVELMGRWVFLGRVRRAHDRPYPSSCFMVTGLKGVWTSITASCLIKRVSEKSFKRNV